MKLPENLKHKVFIVTWEIQNFPKTLEPWREKDQEWYANASGGGKFKAIWLLNKFKDQYFVKGADSVNPWRITPKPSTTLAQIEEFCRQSQVLSYVKKV